MAISRPLVFALVGVLAVAFVLTRGKPAGTSSSPKRLKFGTAGKAQTSKFTQEDLDAAAENRFTIVNTPLKNAFKPLVARSSTDQVAGPGVADDVAGEAGWIYTGMAEIDGVPTALLENTRTQDGVFLKQGESWKGATVYQIKPDELVFMKGGVLKPVRVNIQEETPATAAPQGGFQPVNPPLRGQIGGLAIQPDRTAPRVADNQNRPNRNVTGVEQGTGIGDEN